MKNWLEKIDGVIGKFLYLVLFAILIFTFVVAFGCTTVGDYHESVPCSKECTLCHDKAARLQ